MLRDFAATDIRLRWPRFDTRQTVAAKIADHLRRLALEVELVDASRLPSRKASAGSSGAKFLSKPEVELLGRIDEWLGALDIEKGANDPEHKTAQEPLVLAAPVLRSRVDKIIEELQKLRSQLEKSE